jgi:hypothetical protein
LDIAQQRKIVDDFFVEAGREKEASGHFSWSESDGCIEIKDHKIACSTMKCFKMELLFSNFEN